MDDKSQHVLDKSHFFLLFWDLSDTIWDLYVRSWDLSDLRWDLSYTSWDLSDTTWDLSDLCVGQIPKKNKNLGFVLHELGFVQHFLVVYVAQIPNVFAISQHLPLEEVTFF